MKKEIYLHIMQKALEAYTDAEIDAYFSTVKQEGLTEHGFPRLCANMGILLAHGMAEGQRERFSEMMDLVCEQIPRGKAAHDFSVKEIVLCLLELERAGTFPKEQTERWRHALGQIRPFETYTVIAPDADTPVNNWAAFGAASEQLRVYAGIAREEEVQDFLDIQIGSQLHSFDQNGMYRDPHEPMLYDLATRVQLAVALHFGYGGRRKDTLLSHLDRAMELTPYLQSVTGEIPFGGRSNQFLFNEALLAAISEYGALRCVELGDQRAASTYKRMAALAVDSLLCALGRRPVSHAKNRFPPDQRYGCEKYAYFRKYMITLASFSYLAYVLADDTIEEGVCPAEAEHFAVETSEHFHKTLLSAHGYTVEVEKMADPHYDGAGVGRIHKRGAPSVICLSVPFAKEPIYTLDRQNPSALSLCGGLLVDGEWKIGAEATCYRLLSKEATDRAVSATFAVEWEGAVGLYESVQIAENGVTLSVSLPEGKEGQLCFHVPALLHDGAVSAECVRTGEGLTVSYEGARVDYTARGAWTDTKTVYANRNGHYRLWRICGKEGDRTVSVHIEIHPADDGS